MATLDGDQEMDAILASMSSSARPNPVKKVLPTKNSPPISEKSAECSNMSSSIWNPAVLAPDTVLQFSQAGPLNSSHHRVSSFLSPVHPALEMQRQKTVRILKSKLMDMATNLGLSQLPNSVYESWQFCLKLDSPDGDPLIPCEGSSVTSLKTELVQAGASNSEANKICREMVKHAHRLGRNLMRQQLGRGKKGVHISHQDSKFVEVTYKGHSVRVNKEHFKKLEILFERTSPSYATKLGFKEYLFTLLLRYESLDGGGFQAAINEECFDVLLKHFNCKMECFASPMNCRYGRYCSAFFDTDAVFGSLGSFFSFEPDSGSFEANPPFVPKLIHRMGEHMSKLLSRTKKPLSFIIIIPEWNHTEGWKMLLDSQYNRKYLNIPQSKHGFCEGKQQSRPTRWRIASFDTSVFFWQNDAGAKRWPVTEESLQDLLLAFESKQEKERVDLGLRQGGKRVRKAKDSTQDSKNKKKRRN